MFHLIRKGAACLALGAAAFISTTAQAALYDSTVIADQPLSYYRFNEALPLVAVNNGSLGVAAAYNNVTVGQPSFSAQLGTSALFNGTTSSVRIPDNGAFDVGGGAYTVELWYNTTSTARGDLFTYKGGGGDYGIHSNSQGAPAGYDGSASHYFNAYNGQVAAQINQWHHLVVSRGAGGNTRIYVDGVLNTSVVDTDSWNIANDILVGANHTGDPANVALSFTGRIDEVAIYNKELSSQRVLAHYQAANGSTPTKGIALNFVGAGPTMAAEDVAGHPSVAQGNWNNLTGNVGLLVPLVNSDGQATGVTVNYTGNSVHALPGTPVTANDRMMDGYLDTSSTSASNVTVSNIPFSVYDVVVYFDGDNGGAWRVGNYEIVGVGTLSGEDSEGRDFYNNGNLNGTAGGTGPGGYFQLPVGGGAGNLPYSTLFDPTLTPGNNLEGNFVIFRNLSLTSFTLLASGGANADGNPRAPINGIQIVDRTIVVPEPASISLLGLGALALLRRRRAA